jgi:hypothetical protein
MTDAAERNGHSHDASTTKHETTSTQRTRPSSQSLSTQTYFLLLLLGSSIGAAILKTAFDGLEGVCAEVYAGRVGGRGGGRGWGACGLGRAFGCEGEGEMRGVAYFFM